MSTYNLLFYKFSQILLYSKKAYHQQIENRIVFINFGGKILISFEKMKRIRIKTKSL